METQKVLIKTAYCLVGLAILVLIGLTIFQQQQIKKLSGDVTSETVTKDENPGQTTPGPVENLQKMAAQKSTPAGKEIDELEYQLDAAEEELDMAQEQLSEEFTKQAENTKNMIELQKKMLQDPAYNKMLRNTYKGMLDTTYGALFEELNLASEKDDDFKELLVDQVMSTMDISQEMLGARPSEEKRAELQQRMEDLKEENDTKIHALLGDNDFDTYEGYRERIGERQVVTMFMESLSPDEKLNDEQQQIIIESMYQERKNVYAREGWDENRETFPSETDDKGISKMMDMVDRTYDGYIKSAADTLSSTQMEQFKTYLKNQRDMTESQLKISAQMFGAQTAQSDIEKKSE